MWLYGVQSQRSDWFQCLFSSQITQCPSHNGSQDLEKTLDCPTSLNLLPHNNDYTVRFVDNFDSARLSLLLDRVLTRLMGSKL